MSDYPNPRIFRVYVGDEIGPDGYPSEWHLGIKDAVRYEAGHRCVRCGHPYEGGGEWSPCDERCTHAGPCRIDVAGEWLPMEIPKRLALAPGHRPVQARWRVLTVHHLDGVKANCRWWNLVALCQRCHLSVQSRVQMERVYPWPHSEWFRPYVAGYYASVYLDEDLTREQTEERLDELLGLELAA